MFRIGLDHYFFGVCLILAFKFSLGNPKVCLKSHNASFRFLQSFLQVTLKLLTGCHWSWCHWKCFFLHGGLADAIEVAYCFQMTAFDSNTFCWKFSFYPILSISEVSFDCTTIEGHDICCGGGNDDVYYLLSFDTLQKFNFSFFWT